MILLPPGPFAAILADPPWHYVTRSDKGEGRSAKRHYSVMSMDDICALPVASVAAKDCHLFLWCTGPNVVKGDHVRVITAWGFEPSAMAFVWIKPKRGLVGRKVYRMIDERIFGKGMGYTTRQNAEFVLLGRRGSPKRKRKDIHQIVVAPRREHSRKPDGVHDRIEAYCDGPYLELFARAARPGWTVWGDEVGKFGDAA